MKAQKESRGTALLLLNLGAVWEKAIFVLSRSFNSRGGKKHGKYFSGSWVDPRAFSMGMEKKKI